MRAGVVYLPENPVVRGLFSNLSIGDNLLIPALQKLRPRAGIVGRRMHDYLEKSVEVSAGGKRAGAGRHAGRMGPVAGAA